MAGSLCEVAFRGGSCGAAALHSGQNALPPGSPHTIVLRPPRYWGGVIGDIGGHSLLPDQYHTLFRAQRSLSASLPIACNVVAEAHDDRKLVVDELAPGQREERDASMAVAFEDAGEALQAASSSENLDNFYRKFEGIILGRFEASSVEYADVERWILHSCFWIVIRDIRAPPC